MKKILLIVASVVAMISIAACSGGPRPTPSNETYPSGFLEATPNPVDTPDYTVKTPEPNG